MNLGHLDFDIVSNFELRISDFAGLGIFTTVEKALQIDPFMQNEPNFQKSQMNVTKALTKDYANKTLGERGKNEPNTNPNEANLLNAQMNVTTFLTKDYENKSNWAICENKPNSNPTCSELVEPISERPKMSASSLLTKDYDNVTAYRLQKNKPNQSLS